MNRNWTVMFSNNIQKIAVTGSENDGNTGEQLREVRVLNENLKHLDSYCFNGCTEIGSICLTPTIETIGARCFNACRNAKTISYDIYEYTAPANSAEPSLNGIGAYAFAQCDSMQSITVPASITNISQIDANAFAESNLTSVTFLGVPASQFGIGG